ncbi:MAG: HK97 gp10 family phage protein [Acidobacteriota bacterium]|nr:HK97 gp10 family phage protein [Acidobacteriota bacterium]
MKVTVTIKGEDEIRKALKKMSKEVRKQVAGEIAATALDIQAEAKRNLDEVKAIDTGELRKKTIVEFSTDKMEAEVGTTAPHGKWVEFGTKHTTKMPPPDALEHWARWHGMEGAEFAIAKNILKRGGLPARPWLFPAFEKHAGPFFERIKKILKDII